MIIVMRPHASDEEIEAVTSLIAAMRLAAHGSRGSERTIVGVVGVSEDKDILLAQFAQLDGVESVVPISRSYKLVSREARSDRTIVRLANGAAFGGTELVTAGPCSVESRDQVETTADAVARSGAKLLRGGAFKPRTSPYAFQGLGEEGLKILAAVRERFGLSIVTELLDTETADLVEEYADIVQIGARNMQNFS